MRSMDSVSAQTLNKTERPFWREWVHQVMHQVRTLCWSDGKHQKTSVEKEAEWKRSVCPSGLTKQSVRPAESKQHMSVRTTDDVAAAWIFMSSPERFLCVFAALPPACLFINHLMFIHAGLCKQVGIFTHRSCWSAAKHTTLRTPCVCSCFCFPVKVFSGKV